MRFSRIITGAVTAGLVGLIPVAISSPASAATTYTTASSLAADVPGVVYGDDLTLRGGVVDSAGSAAYTGTVSLQVSSTKAPVWTTIQTDTSPSSYNFYDVKPASNSQYKVVYSGATETDGDVYQASESAPVQVLVQRKVVIKTRELVLMGKVSPDFGGKKVILKRKKGKKFVAWKKIETNNKGQFRVKAPDINGFKFTVTIPSDTHYVGFTAGPYVVR